MIDINQLDKHELISESAHALRGLVGVILNNAGFIARGLDPELVTEDAKEIQAASRKLSVLVDRVIEIIECGNKDYHWIDIDIAELIEDTCLKLQENGSFGTKEYKSEVSCLLPKVRVDGETICRVIELLLLHQIKTSQRDTIHIHAHVAESHVVVTFGSQTPRISQRVDLPTPLRKRELGLELLLACYLLDLHGGSLWVTRDSSEAENEVCLNFSIPMAQSETGSDNHQTA